MGVAGNTDCRCLSQTALDSSESPDPNINEVLDFLRFFLIFFFPKDSKNGQSNLSFVWASCRFYVVLPVRRVAVLALEAVAWSWLKKMF